MAIEAPDKAPLIPRAERIVRIIQLITAVAYHDFSHEMSEDRHNLERGRRQRADIAGREHVVDDDALTNAIWNHFAPDYWKRDE